MYQKISDVEKFYASEREGVSRLSVENFLSHNTEKFRWRTLRCFRKFPVSQNFMHKKGTLLNSIEKFLSHSADKTRRRTLLCFERILVSKIFKQRRGEVSRFCRKFFYLTVPKYFVWESYRFWENFWFQKVLLMKGGVSRFSVKIFLSHSADKLRKGTL